MSWLLGTIALLLLVDALRIRRRLGRLSRLARSDEPASPDHRFITAPGVVLDDATRRAASAQARERGLDLIDIVPGDLPALRSLGLGLLIDPDRYRRDRLLPGHTAGHALVVSPALAERAQIAAGDLDEVGFVRMAARLTQYARDGADIAVAPDARAIPENLERRRAVLRAVLGPSLAPALLVQPLLWTAIAIGFWFAPMWSALVLAVWHAQPLLAIARGPIRARDLARVALARTPLEIWYLLRTLLGRWRPAAAPDPIDSRRADYEQMLADGVDRFWEPRRDGCPLCGGSDLVVHLRCRDLLQHKPGRFTLERCRPCGHIFQNPRLTAAGLDFYYKDFYDGLGETRLDFLFGYAAQLYVARARMVREVEQPGRWLDVGAGHGHFCCAARDELPSTRFDGLDLSESIDEAVRRGWIETGYRGLFPDIAPRVAGVYDAVSMSHYLEHTLDPRRELAAAYVALAPRGCLLIEVPDPEFALGRVLGRYWLPWFQPQHLHLLSAGNLDRLLREHGFTPVAWHRGDAHQRVDFLFAAWLALGRLAPPTALPWRPRSVAASIRRVIVWTLGAPLLIAARLADLAVAPLIRRGRVSNTYRVVARRDGAAIRGDENG